jgi:hypothetical protein
MGLAAGALAETAVKSIAIADTSTKRMAWRYARYVRALTFLRILAEQS